MGKQHIIELNGKRYDAVTGRMVISGSPHKTPLQTVKLPFSPKNVEGFSHASRTAVVHSKPVPSQKIHKSTTLMRNTVPKPLIAQKKSNHDNTQRIKSFASPHSDKLNHAKAVPKSALVRRFFNDDVPAKPISLPPSSHGKTGPNRVQATAIAHTVESTPMSAALGRADSHNQPKLKRERHHVRMARRLKVSPRVVSASTFILAGLLIGGFFAYQNVPNLNMRLAAARAGVNGSLPGYQPAGFTMNGGISYKPGEIIVGYKSNADDRNFKLTQANSAWNSETLLDNYLVANRHEYQVITDKGKTIYLYEGSNATWVDGGVWYKVEGNSKLNSDQLLSLANSL